MCVLVLHVRRAGAMVGTAAVGEPHDKRFQTFGRRADAAPFFRRPGRGSGVRTCREPRSREVLSAAIDPSCRDS